MMRYYFPLLLALVGCAPDGQEVEVAIVNSTGAALAEVCVISGGDKFYFGPVVVGTKERVTLYPGETSDYQVTLFYTLIDQKVVWESDHLLPGNDYFVDINISQGGVRAHH